MGLIPGFGKDPLKKGEWNPFQDSFLRNLMNRRDCHAAVLHVHRFRPEFEVTKQQEQHEQGKPKGNPAIITITMILQSLLLLL